MQSKYENYFTKLNRWEEEIGKYFVYNYRNLVVLKGLLSLQLENPVLLTGFSISITEPLVNDLSDFVEGSTLSNDGNPLYYH